MPAASSYSRGNEGTSSNDAKDCSNFGKSSGGVLVHTMDDDFYGDGGAERYNAFNKDAPGGGGSSPAPTAPPTSGANLRGKTNKIKVEEP